MTGRYSVYGYWRPFAPVDIIYIGQGRDQRPYAHLRLARSSRDADWHGNTRLIQLRSGLALGFEPPVVIIRDRRYSPRACGAWSCRGWERSRAAGQGATRAQSLLVADPPQQIHERKHH